MHINIIIFSVIKHITLFPRWDCSVMTNKYRFNFDFKCFIIWNTFSEFVNTEVTSTI